MPVILERNREVPVDVGETSRLVAQSLVVWEWCKERAHGARSSVETGHSLASNCEMVGTVNTKVEEQLEGVAAYLREVVSEEILVLGLRVLVELKNAKAFDGMEEGIPCPLSWRVQVAQEVVGVGVVLEMVSESFGHKAVDVVIGEPVRIKA